jgi:hypothetical protein
MTFRRNSLAATLPALALVFAACGGEKKEPAAAASASAASDAPAIRVSVAQFKTLQWIVGRWKGTLDDTAAFYTAYRYANDSSIATYAFDDSTMNTVRESGQILLRDGAVTNGVPGTGGWFVVTAFDSNSIHFEPRGSGANSYTWKREQNGTWSATLTWNQAGQTMHRTYLLRKHPPETTGPRRSPPSAP